MSWRDDLRLLQVQSFSDLANTPLPIKNVLFLRAILGIIGLVQLLCSVTLAADYCVVAHARHQRVGLRVNSRSVRVAATLTRELALLIRLVNNGLLMDDAAIFTNYIAIVGFNDQGIRLFAFGATLFVHVDLQTGKLVSLLFFRGLVGGTHHQLGLVL